MHGMMRLGGERRDRPPTCPCVLCTVKVLPPVVCMGEKSGAFPIIFLDCGWITTMIIRPFSPDASPAKPLSFLSPHKLLREAPVYSDSLLHTRPEALFAASVSQITRKQRELCECIHRGCLCSPNGNGIKSGYSNWTYVRSYTCSV